MPLKPWQVLMLVIFVLLALGVIYFMFQASKALHDTKPVVEAADHSNNQKADVFRGPPPQALVVDTVPAKPMPAQIAGDQSKGKTPEQEALDSPLFSGGDGRGGQPPSGGGAPGAEGSRQPVREETAMDASLHTSVLAPVKAKIIADPTHTILPGTLIPCTQATKIDTGSGGPILVKADIPYDVWGANHRVILIDRGSYVVGEVGHGMVNGLDRLAVVWSTLYGPNGAYEVALNSPAAGPLGEGGLDGDVNRHEWQKIKGVLMLSLINGSLNIATALASNHGGGGGGGGGGANLNFYQFSSGIDQAASTLLSSTINIPDTMVRDQGMACSIWVARKLVFDGVWTERVR
jgi:type IV secretion system protein VirB10